VRQERHSETAALGGSPCGGRRVGGRQGRCEMRLNVARWRVIMYCAVLAALVAALVAYHVRNRLGPPLASGRARPSSRGGLGLGVGRDRAGRGASDTATALRPEVHVLDYLGKAQQGPAQLQVPSDHVREFERARTVVAAAPYPGPTPQGIREPAEVYVVKNRLTLCTEVWMVEVTPPDQPYSVSGQRVVEGPGVPTGHLLLLDLNGDGRREVIYGVAGVNCVTTAILDFEELPANEWFGQPEGKEWRVEAVGGPGAPWVVKFGDLDADGEYEMIALVSGYDLRKCDDAHKWPAFKDDETAYFIYHLEDGEYRLRDVLRDDPTKALEGRSRRDG
jgi:hypothetical protein